MIHWLCVRFVFVVVCSLTLSAICFAETSIWSPSVSGNWNTAGRWTPAGVPNNGTPTASSRYDAIIAATGSPYTVTLNGSVAVDSLTLNSVHATIDHTSGTLNLTNDLILNAGTYQFNGGTIRGGTISGTGGEITFQPQGTFDGVTIDRDLTFALGNFSDAWIDVRNGLTLDGGHVVSLMSTPFTNNRVDLRLQGSQTIDGIGTVRAIAGRRNRMFAIDGTATIGPDVTVEATGGEFILGDANSGLVNHGLIWARVGGIVSLEAANWVNEGEMRVSPNSHLEIGGSTTTSNFGTVINDGGELRLNMVLDNQGNIFDFDRIVGPYQYSTATIVGGTVTAANPVTLSPLGSSGDASFDNVTIDVDLIVPHNTLGLRNDVTLNNRRIELREGAAIQFLSPHTLGGTGEIVAVVRPNSSGHAAAFQGSGYTIGPGITIRSGEAVAMDVPSIRLEGDQWTNQGTIISDHGSLTLRGTNWRNEGTIHVNSGVIIVDGRYSHASLGNILVGNALALLEGIMDNAENTFHVGGSAPEWMLNSATIRGGRVEVATDFVMQVSNSVLADTTLAGKIDANSVTYSGNFVMDNATVMLGANDSFRAEGPGTLNGTGRIVLHASPSTEAFFSLPSNAPTLPSGIVVEVASGRGSVFATNGVAWVNEGDVIATGEGSELFLPGNPVTNRSRLAIGSGAVLTADTLLNNSGRIEIQRGAVNTNRGFTQQAAGELIVEIAGSRPGIDYGVFTGQDTTAFAGTLRVVMPQGYSPRVGSRFDILNWSMRSGEFVNVELPPLPFGRTWDTSQLYTLGELSVSGTPPIVETVAFSDFNEPPLGSNSFIPSAAQLELGFVTNSTPNGGLPTASVQSEGTNRVFTHRSVNATTTFDAIDLSVWREATLSLDVAVASTMYETGDFLRVSITDGVSYVNLLDYRGSTLLDSLDSLGLHGTLTSYSAEIPFDWATVSLVIESSSNASAGEERFTFDNVRFTAVAVPEPASATLVFVSFLMVALFSRVRRRLMPRCGVILATLASVPMLGPAVAKGAELYRGDLIVADSGFDAVFRIDPTTGDRTNLSGLHNGTIGSGPLWNNLRSVVWEPEGTLLLSNDDEDIYRVNPANGDRSILTSAPKGTGTVIREPVDMTLSPLGELYVLDGVITGNPAIFRVNRFNGNREIVSSATVGSGPIIDDTRGIAYHEQQGLFVTADNQVLHVDVVTGNRTVIASAEVGEGVQMAVARDVTILDADRLLVAGNIIIDGVTYLNTMYTVSISSGDRTVISNGSLRGAGTNFRALEAVEVGLDGVVYAGDRLGRVIFTVDLATGDRTLFSSGDNQSLPENGSGPPLANVREMAIVGDVLEQQDIVAYGSSWRYLDSGTVIGSNWRSLTFNDTNWLTGIAEFGYGDGDEATVVNCGSTAPACNASNRASTHFRKVVTIDDLAEFSGYIGHVLRDDAAAVYVNGVEVFRDPSLPANSAFNAFATTTSDDNEVAIFLIDPALFVEGPNIIAVQVHQAATTSSDLSFDFHLVGLATPIPEPSTGILAVTASCVLLVLRAKPSFRGCR